MPCVKILLSPGREGEQWYNLDSYTKFDVNGERTFIDYEIVKILIVNQQDIESIGENVDPANEIIFPIVLVYEKDRLINQLNYLRANPFWRSILCLRIPGVHGSKQSKEKIENKYKIDKLIDASTSDILFEEIKKNIEKSLGQDLPRYRQIALRHLFPAVVSLHKSFYQHSKFIYEMTLLMENRIFNAAKMNSKQYSSGVSHAIAKINAELAYGKFKCLPDHPLTPFLLALREMINLDSFPGRIAPNHFPIFRWSVYATFLSPLESFLFGDAKKIICEPKESFKIENEFRKGEQKIVFDFFPSESENRKVGENIVSQITPRNRTSLSCLGNYVEINFSNFLVNNQHQIVRELVVCGNVIDIPEWFERCPTNIFASYQLQETNQHFKVFHSLFLKYIPGANILSIKLLEHILNWCCFFNCRELVNNKYCNDKDLFNSIIKDQQNFYFYATGKGLPREMILGDYSDVLNIEEEKIDPNTKEKIDKVFLNSGIHLSKEPHFADKRAYICKNNENSSVEKKQMIVCCVATGKMEHVPNVQELNSESLQHIPDSLFCYSEKEQATVLCVFNPKQIYPAFLIEYTTDPHQILPQHERIL